MGVRVAGVGPARPVPEYRVLVIELPVQRVSGHQGWDLSGTWALSKAERWGAEFLGRVSDRGPRGRGK